MIRHDEGLTKTYNRFHDPEERSPDILRLRELHAAMDRAVLEAYGWPDIASDCQFILDYEEDDEDETESTGKKRKKKKPWRYRWPDEIRDEVLARLLALNAERHAEEVRLGTAPGMKGAKKSEAKKVAKKSTTTKLGHDELGDLFSRRPEVPTIPALPAVLRTIETDPNIYATALVAALLHEAKGPLPWRRLRDAYVLATTPRLMLDHALPEEKERVSAWASSWNQPSGPEHLLQAILNLGGRNLAVDRSPNGEPIFALQDGALRKTDPHTIYDAWLALRISEPFASDVILNIADFDIQWLDGQILELVA
jgi:hypothetical protein